MTYPADWPRCTCGAPVLDAHLTCGRVECHEAAARDRMIAETLKRPITDLMTFRASLDRFWGGGR